VGTAAAAATTITVHISVDRPDLVLSGFAAAASAAVFRGARAALKLGEWVVCQQLVQQGLTLEPDAQELLQIQAVRIWAETVGIGGTALTHQLWRKMVWGRWCVSSWV
jgi:nucleoside phosphorylase